MTAVTYLPNLAAACDRITARQRAANIAEERAEALSTARKVLANAERYPAQVVRDASDAAVLWGDGMDQQTAELEIFRLNRREWQARNCPRELTAHDRHLAETPADVARSFAHRWPEVLLGGAFGAVVLLAVTGWIS